MLLAPDSSLAQVRAFVARLAEGLDPQSRYVAELNEIVGAARDVPDLLERLARSSRGARHAGAAVFARMSVEERLRCQLVTNETVLFRFSEGEWEELHELVARAAASGAAVRILCAPVSHGEEAFSIASACLQLGAPFAVVACDIQPQCIAEARTGRMTMGFPERYLDSPAVVSREVLERIDFRVADLFREPGSDGGVPGGPWDLAVCRNFLGYFREPLATGLARTLAQRVAPGGALLLDSFCVRKFPSLLPALAASGLRERGAHPVFVRG